MACPNGHQVQCYFPNQLICVACALLEHLPTNKRGCWWVYGWVEKWNVCWKQNPQRWELSSWCPRNLPKAPGHLLRGQRNLARVLPGGSRAAAAIWLSMETHPYLAWLPWRRQAPCLTQRSVQCWSLVGLNNNLIILSFTGQAWDNSDSWFHLSQLCGLLSYGHLVLFCSPQSTNTKSQARKRGGPAHHGFRNKQIISHYKKVALTNEQLWYLQTIKMC